MKKFSGPGQALSLVSFWREGRVVYYRLAGGFPARLFDVCVLMLARLAPRHEVDRPR